jgi:hypothetical protein
VTDIRRVWILQVLLFLEKQPSAVPNNADLDDLKLLDALAPSHTTTECDDEFAQSDGKCNRCSLICLREGVTPLDKFHIELKIIVDS